MHFNVSIQLLSCSLDNFRIAIQMFLKQGSGSFHRNWNERKGRDRDAVIACLTWTVPLSAPAARTFGKFCSNWMSRMLLSLLPLKLSLCSLVRTSFHKIQTKLNSFAKATIKSTKNQKIPSYDPSQNETDNIRCRTCMNRKTYEEFNRAILRSTDDDARVCWMKHHAVNNSLILVKYVTYKRKTGLIKRSDKCNRSNHHSMGACKDLI